MKRTKDVPHQPFCALQDMASLVGVNIGSHLQCESSATLTGQT